MLMCVLNNSVKKQIVSKKERSCPHEVARIPFRYMWVFINNTNERALDFIWVQILRKLKAHNFKIHNNKSKWSGKMKTLIRLFSLALFIFTINSLAFGQDTTLTVASNGNIGIGTTNPLMSLHVKGNASDPDGGLIIESYTTSSGDRDPRIHFRDADGTVLAYIGQHTSGFGIAKNLRIRNMQDGPIYWGTNGTDRVTITNTGDVGIGTLNPQELLHVAGGTIEVYPARDGENGIRIRSADQSRNFVLAYKNDGTIRIGDAGGVMQLSSTFGVESRDFNGTWRPMRASSFDQQSSRHVKQDIIYLQSSDATNLLTQLMQLKPSTYRYVWQDESEMKSFGFIAEELPEVITSSNGRAVNLYHLSTMTVVSLQAFYRQFLKQTEMVKQLQQENRNLSERLAELEALVKSLASEKTNVPNKSMDRF